MKENKKYFVLLWRYLKEDKVKLFGCILCYLSMLFPAICVPYLLGLALEFLTQSDFSNFIYALIAAQVLNIIFYVLVSVILDKLYYSVEKKVINLIIKDLYVKVNQLPAIAFEDMGVGEFSNRLYTDPNTIVELAFKFITGMYSIIKSLIIFIVVFNVSFILGIQVTLFAVSMFAITRLFMPRIKKTQEKVSKSGDIFLKTNTENLSGIREIKSLGIKNILAKKVFLEVEEYTENKRKINLHEVYYYGLNNFVFYFFQVLIFLTMGYMYINGVISITVYVMIQSYIWNLDYAVNGISQIGVSYSKIVVALKRIDEILNNRLYEDEKFGTKNIKNLKGKISFKDVNFKYKEEEDFILNNLNLEFLPNEKNAIIGKSGNGKSTLFNLLLRYFDATTGLIEIDDTNILDLSEESLRENISIIRQQPFLFNESISTNFKMVKPDVTEEEIISVCKKAYIHDYIVSLKNGYETIIGEGGVNLSGGQKQRIAIARTLLLDTKIILFDEATSALDNEAQEYVKKTIDDLVKTHTVIIVAHRLSTIVDADKIFVIDKGTLAATGTHKELIENNEIYQKLYKNEDLIK